MDYDRYQGVNSHDIIYNRDNKRDSIECLLSRIAKKWLGEYH